MDILKNLDKITDHITELESIKQAASDFISHFNYDRDPNRLTIEASSAKLADADLLHLRSLILKGKD